MNDKCYHQWQKITICWYVDDDMLRHAGALVASNIIQKIKSKFEKMTVTCRLKHEFLGMDIVFNKDGSVTIGMASYVKQTLGMFHETITTNAVIPASWYLFELCDNNIELDQDMS